MLIFTSLGNVIYRPVHELSDIRWKEIGEHLSQTISNFDTKEEVIYTELLDSFEEGTYFGSDQAGTKSTSGAQSSVLGGPTSLSRLALAKLKNEDDQVIALAPIKLDDVMLVTKNGYALRFNIEEVPVMVLRQLGLKPSIFKKDDVLAAALSPTQTRFTS